MQEITPSIYDKQPSTKTRISNACCALMDWLMFRPLRFSPSNSPHPLRITASLADLTARALHGHLHRSSSQTHVSWPKAYSLNRAQPTIEKAVNSCIDLRMIQTLPLHDCMLCRQQANASDSLRCPAATEPRPDICSHSACKLTTLKENSACADSDRFSDYKGKSPLDLEISKVGSWTIMLASFWAVEHVQMPLPQKAMATAPLLVLRASRLHGLEWAKAYRGHGPKGPDGENFHEGGSVWESVVC